MLGTRAFAAWLRSVVALTRVSCDLFKSPQPYRPSIAAGMVSSSGVEWMSNPIGSLSSILSPVFQIRSPLDLCDSLCQLPNSGGYCIHYSAK
jgi:hypothetical protein